MTSLSDKHQSFLKLMKEGELELQRGFKLLASYTEPEIFFPALKDAGLLDAARFKGPQKAEKGSGYWIPYYNGLDYLRALSRRARATNNHELAEEIITLIRRVSEHKDKSGGTVDNYHTWREFAAILAEFAPDWTTPQEIELLGLWLESKFNNSLVANVVGEKLLPKLLDSVEPKHWAMAVRILELCTAFRISVEGNTEGKPEFESLIEEHWLGKLLERNSHCVRAEGATGEPGSPTRAHQGDHAAH